MPNIKTLTVRFTETADEEIHNLVHEMQLIPIAEYLRQSNEPLPEELKSLLASLFSTITDLFSTELPLIDTDPESTLRAISRDINLARLLRERGLFRLYRLVHQKDKKNIPLYMALINPTTGSPFSRQEEFIGWFCEEAHVARSLAFMRIATIDRLLTLGHTIQEAFTLVVSKPWAIRETLNLVAEWEKGELVSISPEIAMNIARRIDPAALPEITSLAEFADDDPDAMEDLKEATKPLIVKLLQEVSSHDRAKDAMDFVRYDVLKRPEIKYSWDKELDCLMVVYTQKVLDQQTGQEYVTDALKIPFLPDVRELPDEVRKDIQKRLPMSNRNELEN